MMRVFPWIVAVSALLALALVLSVPYQPATVLHSAASVTSEPQKPTPAVEAPEVDTESLLKEISEAASGMRKTRSHSKLHASRSRAHHRSAPLREAVAE